MSLIKSYAVTVQMYRLYVNRVQGRKPLEILVNRDELKSLRDSINYILQTEQGFKHPGTVMQLLGEGRFLDALKEFRWRGGNTTCTYGLKEAKDLLQQIQKVLDFTASQEFTQRLIALCMEEADRQKVHSYPKNEIPVEQDLNYKY